MAGDVEEHIFLSSCWYCVGLQTFWSWIHLGGEQLHRQVGCAALWSQEGLRPLCPVRDVRTLGMGRANWPLQRPSWRNPMGKSPRGKRDLRELGNIQGSLLADSITSLWARNGAKGAGELQGWTWNSVRREWGGRRARPPWMDTGMGSECALVCSSMAMSADGREVRDHVPGARSWYRASCGAAARIITQPNKSSIS